jgi:hypothetical protein
MMKVRFIKPRGDYKPGDDVWLERTLARRLCDNGRAVPFGEIIKKRREKEQAERFKQEKAKALAKKLQAKKKEKAKAAAEKKKKAKKKTAVSRKRKDSEKAVIE